MSSFLHFGFLRLAPYLDFGKQFDVGPSRLLPGYPASDWSIFHPKPELKEGTISSHVISATEDILHTEKDVQAVTTEFMRCSQSTEWVNYVSLML